MYKISQGKHYADGVNFAPVIGKTRGTYEVSFTPSCIYDLGNDDQADVNKLCGWGHIDHRANSVRFGWRCVSDKIELVGYLHVSPNTTGNGDIRIYPFTPALLLDIGTRYRLTIVMQNAGNELEYVMEVLLNGASVARQSIRRPKLSWMQRTFGMKNYPYFGGNQVAPHDILIDLNEM